MIYSTSRPIELSKFICQPEISSIPSCTWTMFFFSNICCFVLFHPRIFFANFETFLHEWGYLFISTWCLIARAVQAHAHLFLFSKSKATSLHILFIAIDNVTYMFSKQNISTWTLWNSLKYWRHCGLPL